MILKLLATAGLLFACTAADSEALTMVRDGTMLKNDAQIIGACQATFAASQIFLQSSFDAIKGVKGEDTAAEELKELSNTYGKMTDNIENFDALFGSITLDRAIQSGIPPETMLFWRREAILAATQILATETTTMVKAPRKERASKDFAFVLMPQVRKCVNWYSQQRSITVS